MAINLRRDAWKDDRQFDDIRQMALEIERLRRETEERTGIFVPGLTFGGSAAGITWSVQAGQYYRQGTFVYCIGTVAMTNNGSGTGNAVLTGLPFNVKDVVAGGVGGLGHMTAYNNIGAALDQLFLASVPGGKTAAIQRIAAGATTLTNATEADLTNTFGANFVLIYQTSDA